MGLKIFCFFMLSIFACSKVNQWKQPTKVCFNITVAEESSMDGALFFKEGYMTVESFKFDGERTEGADVYFTKRYTQELKTLFGATNVSDLEFDVPQGVYTEINLELISEVQSKKPNLVVSGFFESKIGKLYPVRFELTENEHFPVVGEDLVDSDTEVDLIQVTKTKATILLNPANWFRILTKEALEQAEKVPVEGINTILINNTINGQLYKDVVAALEMDTAKAIFVKQS
ncbi:MAG: Unknown protein [uncultured Aureispira sp.]|uniref:Uncharacterized protein n=1 Tax=uncultured Aureispira sp. TaxID=1331704 RepID=A0A6S6U2R7_9BACT|nr:MAG: Unknown protein [uncultured Aureispira sp.]